MLLCQYFFWVKNDYALEFNSVHTRFWQKKVLIYGNEFDFINL